MPLCHPPQTANYISAGAQFSQKQLQVVPSGSGLPVYLMMQVGIDINTLLGLHALRTP